MISLDLAQDTPMNALHFDSVYESIHAGGPATNPGLRLDFQCDASKRGVINIVITNTSNVNLLCDPLFGKAMVNRKVSLSCATSDGGIFESAASYKLEPKQVLMWPISNLPSGLFVCSFFCGELGTSTMPGVFSGGVVCN